MDDSFKERISKYTLKDLIDIEANVDKNAYPDKHAFLNDQIAKRRASGEYVPQAYACPTCRKLTISHCDMQKTAMVKCKECGAQHYLDPYRSGLSTCIGILGVLLGSGYKSMSLFLIGMGAMFLYRDKCVTFVSKDVNTYRTNTSNLIVIFLSALVSLWFLLWALFTDPSNVPDPRAAFIVMLAVMTVVCFAFAVHYFKKRKKD